jgi:uncharacterized membrane protein YhaH (DUF805 family)
MAMTFAQKMFSFEGRMGRQDFWVMTLIIWGFSISMFIALTVLGWGAIFALGSQARGWDRSHADFAEIVRFVAPIFPLIGIWVLLQLALIWPQLAICAKRLHDRDQSALWLLMYVGVHVLWIIPILGFLMIVPARIGLFIWWVVNLGCLEGTPGPNRYGEAVDPRFGPEPAFA